MQQPICAFYVHHLIIPLVLIVQSWKIEGSLGYGVPTIVSYCARGMPFWLQ